MIWVGQNIKGAESTNKRKQWENSHRLTHSLIALELSLAEFFANGVSLLGLIELFINRQKSNASLNAGVNPFSHASTAYDKTSDLDLG